MLCGFYVLMIVMRVVNWQVLKLAISVGLLVGLMSVSSVFWPGEDWWMRNWRLLRELLGLGWGVVYVINFKDEIVESKNWGLLISRYGVFVLSVVLVWLGWSLLVWVASGGSEVGQIDFWSGDAPFGTSQAGVAVVLRWMVEGLRMVGWGLLVVLGYRWFTMKQKNK